MTKKFNWKIFTCLALLLAIVITTVCLVVFFVTRQARAYTGYDGYIWYGTERSNKRAEEKVAGDDAFEHTLEIAETMTKYFDGGYVDLSNSYIALLPHYQKYTNTVIFSELKIKNITVFAKNDGNLDVSIANVEDVVKSRTSKTPLNVKKVNTFQVSSGQTTIDFEEPIFIDTNETIVLGGNGSVSLYYAKNIPVSDEAGNFTLIDGMAHENLLQGGQYNDTLAVEVKVVTDEAKPIFENLKEHVEKDIGRLSVMQGKTGDNYWGPYIYGYALSNGNAFENKTITKISVPVQNLKKNGKLPYLDMYIIPTYKVGGVTPLPDSEEVIEKRQVLEVLTQNKVEPLAIKTEEEYQEKLGKLTQVGDYHFGWVDFDCHYVIPDGYTLAFGGLEGGVEWLFANHNDDEKNLGVVNEKGIGGIPYYNQLRFIGLIGKKGEKEGDASYSGFTELHRMFFDCYYQHSWSIEEQVEKIISAETPVAKVEKLREVLSGKQISVLGDSISTYDGYSNEYETQNSDIKGNGYGWVEDETQHNYYGNRVAYPDVVSNDLSSADDTWWLRTINQINANLCVNNSFSGGLITDNLTIKRSEQLHDNTKYSDFANEKNKGQNADIYPDIVAIYMGINDFNAGGEGVEPSTFYTYYKRIVLNILKNYIAHSPNLKVFVFTIPPSSAGDSKWSNVKDEYLYRQNIEKFNNKIRQIAEEIENVELVDLFNYYNMTRMESQAYANDYLHPNTAGMKLISECFIDTLYKKYVIN